MDDRLSETQLQRIVAEVEQISNHRQQELDQEQVREILQELNLSPDLLEEAMIQLKRRDALVIQQRRQRRIILGVVLSALVIVGGLGFLVQQHQQALSRVGAQQDRVTLVNQDATTIPRQPASRLSYEVTLRDAPIGKKLNLTCNWLDPTNQVVHQNRYTTKEIKVSPWPTRCRYDGPTTTPGTWRVQMLLGDRILSEATFDVK